MMQVAIPKERAESEKRCAAVPETVVKMIAAGLQVSVEADAGSGAFFHDQDYEKAGAKIVRDDKSLAQQAEIFLFVQVPETSLIKCMKDEAMMIGPFAPLSNLPIIDQLNAKKITAFSLEFLPRIARAQSMDILSSMSNLAGYKSVILAADHLPKLFPMMTTAAGTIRPAKVMVIGVGVSGLQAIATAKRLGARVLGFDTRPITAEQVKSLGAEFVSMETTHESAQDQAGYAKEQSADFYQHEQEIIRQYARETDVIITTALIPFKRAPLLITEAMVKEMPEGSVIVDLAVAQRGNCALSEPGKIVRKYGVTIIGLLNLPSLLAVNASMLYAKNLWAFLHYLLPQLTAQKFDFADEIIKGCMLTFQGESIHPILKR